MRNLSHFSDKVNHKFSLLPGKIFSTGAPALGMVATGNKKDA